MPYSGSTTADEDENVITSAADVPESLSIGSVEEDAVMKKVALSAGGMFTPIGTNRTSTAFVLMNPQRVPYTEAMLKLQPESIADEPAMEMVSLKSKSAAPVPAKPLPNPKSPATLEA